MKYLQILNLTLLALGTTLAVVLAVESLIYTLYLDAAPQVRRQLPLLLRLTATLCGFSIASLLAYLGHRRQALWRWPAQVLPAMAMAAVVLMLTQLGN